MPFIFLLYREDAVPYPFSLPSRFRSTRSSCILFIEVSYSRRDTLMRQSPGRRIFQVNLTIFVSPKVMRDVIAADEGMREGLSFCYFSSIRFSSLLRNRTAGSHPGASLSTSSLIFNAFSKSPLLAINMDWL
jgi:hypothetical protein